MTTTCGVAASASSLPHPHALALGTKHALCAPVVDGALHLAASGPLGLMA
jgi:hypothetical protein